MSSLSTERMVKDELAISSSDTVLMLNGAFSTGVDAFTISRMTGCSIFCALNTQHQLENAQFRITHSKHDRIEVHCVHWRNLSTLKCTQFDLIIYKDLLGTSSIGYKNMYMFAKQCLYMLSPGGTLLFEALCSTGWTIKDYFNFFNISLFKSGSDAVLFSIDALVDLFACSGFRVRKVSDKSTELEAFLNDSLTRNNANTNMRKLYPS